MTAPQTPCPNPVFVIGAPRSGTSILAWSLAAHDAFWTSQETDVLHLLFGDARAVTAYELATERSSRSWLLDQSVSQAEFLQALGLGINALFTSRSGGRRWIDSTPSYTLMADVLAVMFPGASFLHILRDGRDVVNSMIHSGFRQPWATDFREACRTWVAFVECALGFAADYPTRCLTVRHDELVGDPSAQFARIQEFLDVPGTEAPATFFRGNRINSSFASRGPGASALGDAQLGWRDWPSDRWETFRAEAGRTMLRLGFADSHELGGVIEPAPPPSRGSQERVRQAGPIRGLWTEIAERDAVIRGLRAALEQQVTERDAVIRDLRAALEEQSAWAQRSSRRLRRIDRSLPMRLYRTGRRLMGLG